MKFAEFGMKSQRRFDRDVSKLVAHYQKLDEKYWKSGKYKFVDPPSEESKSAESVDAEVVD